MRTQHDRYFAASRFAAGLLMALALSGGTGCSALQGINNYLTYNDSVNDAVLGWRNHVWARQAWFERKSQFYGQPHFSHFGAGFRSGYINVASGGNGCPPGIAPREYWTWKYQTPEGQGQVAAWFAGYPYGAQAAEEDGAGLYQQIQVSHFMEQQYSPEFQYSVGTQEEPPPATTAPRGPAGETVPAPVPTIQDPPPPLNSQSRLNSVSPAYLEAQMPREMYQHQMSIPPVSAVAPAAYYEPSKRSAAASIPANVPVRTPATSSSVEFQVNPWALSR